MTSCSALIGQVNPAFLTYQSRDGASRLFSALGDPTPIFQTFSGDAPLSITFSEPDDQVSCDWWTPRVLISDWSRSSS